MTDWQKGDLALCVKGGVLPGGRAAATPRAGQVITVENVTFGPIIQCPSGVTLLWSEDLPRNGSGDRKWAASRFRKVTPPKADEFDREVIDLMNRKPVEA